MNMHETGQIVYEPLLIIFEVVQIIPANKFIPQLV